jgi:hypothetical protein
VVQARSPEEDEHPGAESVRAGSWRQADVRCPWRAQAQPAGRRRGLARGRRAVSCCLLARAAGAGAWGIGNCYSHPMGPTSQQGALSLSAEKVARCDYYLRRHCCSDAPPTW